MSESVLVRWSRRAAIIAGVSWPVVFGSALLIVVFTGQMAGPPPDITDPEILGLAVAFYVPFAIMILSVAGVSRRYAVAWGVLGRVGCALALSGLAVVPFMGMAAMVGNPQDFPATEYGRVGFAAGIIASIVLGVGFMALGAAALRSATPSRWFGVVLIGVGVFQPAILLVSVFRILAYSGGWIVLGIALPSLDGDLGHPVVAES